MCAARLIFLTLPYSSSYFWLTEWLFITRPASKLCPERFKVWSVCATLLLRLDMILHLWIHRKARNSRISCLKKKELVRCLHTQKEATVGLNHWFSKRVCRVNHSVIPATWLGAKIRHAMAGRQRISVCVHSSCRFSEILAVITIVYHELILQISPVMQYYKKFSHSSLV